MKLYMFRAVPLSIIRSFSLWMELSPILILLASCLQTCMTYTSAVCTVKNSWWWTEELPEICRGLFQNKFEILVHLVGFIIREVHLVGLYYASISRCTVHRMWNSHSTFIWNVGKFFNQNWDTFSNGDNLIKSVRLSATTVLNRMIRVPEKLLASFRYVPS